jgi:hypothetical protein
VKTPSNYADDTPVAHEPIQNRGHPMKYFSELHKACQKEREAERKRNIIRRQRELRTKKLA